MHDLCAGDDLRRRKGAVLQIRHDALRDGLRRALLRRHTVDRAVVLIRHAIKRGHIDAGDLRGGAEKAGLVPAAALCLQQQRQKLVVQRLSLAQNEEIHEIRHGLRVAAAASACENQRQKGAALFRVQWNTRQVQHIQHGGICHLIAKGKAEGVELPQRVPAFQGVERDGVFPHLALHVVPWGEHPLAPNVLHGVDRIVKDAHAEIGHADLVNVGKAQRHTQRDMLFVLDDLVIFPAGVARRLLYPRQDAFQSCVHEKAPFFSN